MLNHQLGRFFAIVRSNSYEVKSENALLTAELPADSASSAIVAKPQIAKVDLLIMDVVRPEWEGVIWLTLLSILLTSQFRLR